MRWPYKRPYVILSEAKNLPALRVNSAKDLSPQDSQTLRFSQGDN